MKKFLLTLVIAYVGFVGTLYLTQRRMIYYPDRTRPAPAAWGVADMAPVTLRTSDRLDLLAWWRPPDAEGAPVIAYFHGNAGHLGYRGPKVRPYLDAGLGVLLLAWRGYSGNPGGPSEQGLYADGRAALAFIDDQGVSAERIVLYGESLGSGVAVQLATERPVAALILEAPFTSIADVAQHKFPVIPARLMVRDRFDSASKIGAITTPLLIVHGEGDRTVPVVFGRRLLEAANAPKCGHFIPGASHDDLYDHGAVDAVLSFLRRHLTL